MYYFCTYFDENYLTRGLALYESLVRNCNSFNLWVLCMSKLSYEVMSKLNLPNVRVIDLEDLERQNKELLSVKQSRSLIEYYFTCTPSLPLFILENFQYIDLITYLDADLFFFSDPKPIFDEISDNSIAIIPHRFPQNMKHLEIYGIYNVGWVSFRNDKNSVSCLRWWKQRCIEWCYDRCENGRFADQKYLDQWPSLFQKVSIIVHKGANLAPWNISNYKIISKNKKVFVDEYPLIFYHFHRLKRIQRWVYDMNLRQFGYTPSYTVLKKIYAPYIMTLNSVSSRIKNFLGNMNLTSSIRDNEEILHSFQTKNMDFAGRLMKLRQILKGIYKRWYILVVNGIVL